MCLDVSAFDMCLAVAVTTRLRRVQILVGELYSEWISLFFSDLLF